MGSVRVWYTSFCVRAVVPTMSAKPPGIFQSAYMSTFSVLGTRTFLNIYKILNIAALYALMTNVSRFAYKSIRPHRGRFAYIEVVSPSVISRNIL